jgi:hypothetical protein
MQLLVIGSEPLVLAGLVIENPVIWPRRRVVLGE